MKVGVDVLDFPPLIMLVIVTLTVRMVSVDVKQRLVVILSSYFILS